MWHTSYVAAFFSNFIFPSFPYTPSILTKQSEQVNWEGGSIIVEVYTGALWQQPHLSQPLSKSSFTLELFFSNFSNFLCYFTCVNTMPLATAPLMWAFEQKVVQTWKLSVSSYYSSVYWQTTPLIWAIEQKVCGWDVKDNLLKFPYFVL